MSIDLDPRVGRLAAVWLLALSALAGCGGGDDPRADDTPATGDDRATTAWNTAVTLDVLANDRDPAGGALVLAALGTPPAHGTATVADGRVVYTPAPGTFGTDAFTYTVLNDRGRAGTGKVEVSVQAKATLAGRTAGVALPGARITVAAGTTTATATADEQGRWSVPLTFDDPDALVTLTAQGVGAQSAVKLLGIVGSAGSLVALADASGQISDAALAAARLTPVGTATAALAAAANGGAMPATPAAWDAARAQVDAGAALSMAASIRAVADGGAALPAQAADTLALVTDAATYATWFAVLPTGRGSAHAQALSALKIDPALATATWRLPDAARPTVVYHLLTPPPCCGSSVNRAELRADGTAVLEWSGSAPQAATWKAVDGIVVATYDTPQVFELDSSGTNAAGQRVKGTYTVRGYEFAVLAGDAAGGVTAVREKSSLTWADPSYTESYPEDALTSLYRHLDARTLRTPTASDIAGHAFAGLKSPSAPWWDHSSDTAEFAADGSGRLRRAGTVFAWAIGADGLVLTHADGTRQTVRIAPAAADAPARRWHVGETGSSGAIGWGESLVVPADTAAAPLTAARMTAHAWRYDFTPPLSADRLAITLEPDGTGQRFSVPITWSVVDGKVELRDAASKRLVETWEPIADTGSALYVTRIAWTPGGQARYHRVVRVDKAG